MRKKIQCQEKNIKKTIYLFYFLYIVDDYISLLYLDYGTAEVEDCEAVNKRDVFLNFDQICFLPMRNGFLIGEIDLLIVKDGDHVHEGREGPPGVFWA